MSTPSPTGPGSPTGDDRFRPGGTSEARARAYGESVGVTETEVREVPEDSEARSARLRRRRRLLTWGGAPAAIVLLAAVWMGAVSLLTLLGNRAAIHEDYKTAVSRYSAVATLNPVLEQWRVHYNLGTAQLLAGSLDPAVSELEEALSDAPKAGTVTGVDSNGNQVSALDPTAPECLVRVNLYVSHLALAQEAQDGGDSATAQEERTKATEAAGECAVPPQDPSSDPSATPSSDPSSDPSSTPSQDPSATPSSDPSSSASQDPSASASPQPSATASSTPSQDPSATASQPASAEPTSSPFVSQGPTSTPSPVDEKQKELDERNGSANSDGGGSVGGTKDW